MRIELLGPSGVGKTTVLRIAEAHRGSTYHWMGPGEIDAYLTQLRKSRDADTTRTVLNGPEMREFLQGCIEIIASSGMLPAQKLAALEMLKKACLAVADLHHISPARPLVHDELLLHRAFSLLPQAYDIERDGTWYFTHVPVPDAAAVFVADPDVIAARALARGHLPNCYAGLEESDLYATCVRLVRLCHIADQALRARGVPCVLIDANGPPERSAASLQDLITSAIWRHSLADYPEQLKARLLAESSDFRQKEGRHQLRTRGVYYCAFHIPGFELERARSQRDAACRIARFGLTEAKVRGASILDLGANVGAMLFQLSNFGPSYGLGIEFDREKVALAREIASYAGLPHLHFQQGDIDELDPDALGLFDIVLALAVEAHVRDPDHLYWLLGRVTRRVLCFEGNSGCDMRSVRAKLLEQGFTATEYLGLCDDDILPENNKRPLLIAYMGEDARARYAISAADKDRLRNQLEPIRKSFSYRLGNMLVQAVASPGRNTILLPYRLVRLCVAEFKKRKTMTVKPPRAN